MVSLRNPPQRVPSLAGRTLKGTDLRRVRGMPSATHSSTIAANSSPRFKRVRIIVQVQGKMSLRARSLIVVTVVALTLANLELSSCLSLQGKVTCLDCEKGHHLSGIIILVKCGKVKKPSVGTTSRTGFFHMDLPQDRNVPHYPPTNCLAQVVGGLTQIYASEKNMVSKLVKAYPKRGQVYTTATPLTISTRHPDLGGTRLGSSKTIDLPLPPEWGLAPTSYYTYTPFIPIIGIP
ncbi:hypothetical protein MLD38_017224 [Melastoma candidum]|uniref:Uncharacterized protein n=1 Tax=Melastoma candidum TaxID=119954 RepID=A0ACB9QRU2_9MYRT|nr:hypothetical protein MLD38_017224 [Melastoma candidum]